MPTGSPPDKTTRRPYRVVSADQHINEPPDLWTSRVATKYRSRVPRMERFEQGDAWVMEGVADPINFGLNACSGRHPDEISPWVTFDSISRGGYDGKVRLEEMDLDGVDAGLNFPSPCPSMGVSANPDADLHHAMVSAYNDWLAEYCSVAPDRIFGMMALPNRTVAGAVAEFERMIERPGIAGPLLLCYPHGTATISPEDDALWSVIEQSGKPVTVHVALSDQMPAAHKPGIPGDIRISDVSARMLELMWSGVLDRFPKLKWVFAEVDAGWIPFFKEQVDNRFNRLSHSAKYSLTRRPSEYFDDHFVYAFITDTYAIANRHAVGLENLLWSDDFPHLGADWPYSARTIAASFAGVPRSERDLMLSGNTTRLYGLPGLSGRP